ncbi:hypothetical protein [Mesorhizobium sp. CN2-181]
MNCSGRGPAAILLLLENKARVGQHKTGHNSGVIHARIMIPAA